MRADLAGGLRSGVNGTPTFFVNGRRDDAGFSFEEVTAALMGELATLRSADAEGNRVGTSRRGLHLAGNLRRGPVDRTQLQKEIAKLTAVRADADRRRHYSAVSTWRG